MRTRATIYFKYSKNSSRAVSGFSHQASTRTFSETTAYGTSATSGSSCASSAMARGMWKFAVTTISDWKPRAFDPAPRLDGVADGVVAEWSISTQQANQRWCSGTRREISPRRVAGLTPLMSRRLPRPAASRSSASLIRNGPPVSATMPSALRAGRGLGRSASGGRTTRNPPPSSAAARPGPSARCGRRDGAAAERPAACRRSLPLFLSRWRPSVPIPGRMITQNPAPGWHGATRPFPGCG